MNDSVPYISNVCCVQEMKVHSCNNSVSVSYWCLYLLGLVSISVAIHTRQTGVASRTGIILFYILRHISRPTLLHTISCPRKYVFLQQLLRLGHAFMLMPSIFTNLLHGPITFWGVYGPCPSVCPS